MSIPPQITGTLKTWNQDKGFGFITPNNGGQDIFVHISAYPRAGGAPQVGEPLVFEVTLNKEGKKKAVKVQRPGQPTKQRQARPSRQPRQDKPSLMGRIFFVVLVIALAGAGYSFLAPTLSPSHRESSTLASVQAPVESSSLAGVQAPMASSSYQCDGRRYCSQMNSCEEAKYFLRNCPGTEMDGDHDGIPCESQWCTSPFAK